MICRYCGREHDVPILCRGVSRRRFFFFGAAAAVAAVVKTPAVQKQIDLTSAYGSDRWAKSQFEGSFTGAIKGLGRSAGRREVDSILAEARRRVPVDTGALHVPAFENGVPIMTVGYGRVALPYALSLETSADGKNWSKL